MDGHTFVEPFIDAAAVDEPLYEVIHGERRELPPMGAFEVSLGFELGRILGNYASERRLGLVVAEVLFVLNAEAELRRRPDVAFVSYGRWPTRTIPRTEAWDVVPDLAVEIISATNLAEHVDDKLTDYFQAGVRLVWVIYPSSGRIYVHSAPKQVRILDRNDELDGGDVLPGFRVRIAALYEPLTKPE
jgi:Uma2 family endonuclease